KEASAERPADEEGGLDPGAIPRDERIGRLGHVEKLGDEGRGHEHVEVHVEPVEKPAKPGGNSRLPLRSRKVTQAGDSRLGSAAGGFGEGLDWGWPVHVYIGARSYAFAEGSRRKKWLLESLSPGRSEGRAVKVGAALGGCRSGKARHVQT